MELLLHAPTSRVGLQNVPSLPDPPRTKAESLAIVPRLHVPAWGVLIVPRLLRRVAQW